MDKMLPPDQIEREKIATVLKQNFLVEAGAGSGKTSSLVKRMVSEIETGTFEVKELAAVTFTRKAAAELRERFQNKLEETYRKTTEPILLNRLEQALQDLDQCFLGTIHSFCARLLRERPVEAGLDPEFKELDGVEEKLLQAQAWDQYLLAVKLNKPSILENLENLGISPLELKTGFIELSKYPDVNLVFEKIAKPDLIPAFETLKLQVEKAENYLPLTEPEKGYDGLQKALLKMLRHAKYFDLTQEKNLVKVLAEFEKEPKVTQNRWANASDAKALCQEFMDLAVNVIGPLMEAWREYCHYYIMEFLLPAVEHYQNLRYELSLLNFQDLLMLTAKMLKEYPEVREYFQAKYRCLLIDEFQDTDPIQAEIMFYLTGTDTTEKEWQKLVPKAGSLFVVGDPKQSIYRFRRADIDTYNLVKELIKKSGGEVLKLTANFRSLNALGEWFNPVFKKLLPAEGSLYQAEFSPMHTIWEDITGTGRGVKVLEIPDCHTKKADIVAADAEYIATYIKWALAGNLKLARTPEELEEGLTEKPRPKDFMLLLRYKDSMEEYARALEGYGIPVAMAGGSSLRESREIHELYKLLKFLANPEDQVALVAVLRGILYGFSDDDLYQYKLAGGNFDIFTALPENLEKSIKSRLSEVLSNLKAYYRWSVTCLPTVTLEKIIIDLGLINFALSGAMIKSKCGYIYQVLEQLRKAEANGVTSFKQMVGQLTILLESDIEEELNILPEEDDAVRIMNLHKAKGLEAPVVFLAHPCKKTEARAEQHVKRIGQQPQGYFVFSKANGEFASKVIGQPLDWSAHEAEEIKYLEAEETRLVYVAATRAKNMLVISHSLKDTKKNPWAKLLEDLPKESNLQREEALKKAIAEAGKEITPAMLEEVRKGFGAWLPALSTPSYILQSPTGLKEDSTPSVQRTGGRGTVWGTIVHRLMEEIIKGEDHLEDLVLTILREEGESSELVPELLDYIESFKSSELWQRLMAAETKLTEVPFSLKVERDNPLYPEVRGEEDLPILLSGYIDLAFKESDGWVIADYKTDGVEKEEDLIRLYSKQVILYCKIWQQLTGEQVKSGELWWVQAKGIKKLQVY